VKPYNLLKVKNESVSLLATRSFTPFLKFFLYENASDSEVCFVILLTRIWLDRPELTRYHISLWGARGSETFASWSYGWWRRNSDV